ncbi:Uncharacterized protein TCM_040333 [Theobroma cacao]|uniref:Reverse transcriptase Ty1/copia-type domain-containing protein n=1 Tax=Theobroma cacao TaxID=3641 RepID=A0A061GSD0_THECC|nr:Uncharacterized protein TCM_040333 [Theobroma cacao]
MPNTKSSSLREKLAIRFERKNLGELKHFLGLEVSEIKEGLFLSQSYIKKLVEKFDMADCKAMEQNLNLRSNEGCFFVIFDHF